MPGQSGGENIPREESSKQQERAGRIMDAAAELIQRWGYKKTTIDDVARAAHVAKGTIYLHWKTREDLFRAVIIRESSKLTQDIQQRIASDPQGATLHGLLKHSALATMKRPLWMAVLKRDTEMLGELSRAEINSEVVERSLASITTYFELLRRQGLLRTDLSIKELVYMQNAITMGFLLTDQFLPDDFKLSDEHAADLLADAVKRTFAPGTFAMSEYSQEASQALTQYMGREMELIKDMEQKETEA